MIRSHSLAVVRGASFMVALAAASATTGAFAAQPTPASAPAFTIRASITATLNGKDVRLSPPAREVSGRLYLPLRPLAQALQVPVRAQGDRIELELPDRTVDFTVGAAEFSSAGQTVGIGAPILRIDGVTYVPLRFVSAALGAQVSFDAAAQRVAIVSIFAGASEAPPTEEGVRGAVAQVAGTVSAVDRNSQPPTVTVLQNNVPRTISMTSQAKVILQDVSVHTTFAGALADIQPGDELAATIDPSGAVIQVVDFFASHAGAIAAVSGSTFVLKDGRVVTPPSTSVVTLNGAPARVSDLHVGDRVTLRYNPQTDEVKTVIVSRPSAGTPPPGAAVSISSFTIDAARPLRAGETLNVSMTGTPGGTATFDLGPIIQGLPMTEVSPGHYRGSFHVTEGINLTDISVFGNLTVGGMSAPRAEAPTQLSIATTPPQITDIAPMSGESVNNDQPNIFATFTSPTQIGIDPNSIRLVVNGHDVTSLATRNSGFVVYSPGQAMAPGTVNVSVSVADTAGNVVSRSWSFTISR